MADYFVKLHTKIVDSSIWNAPYPTRIVWLTLLAKAGFDGLVQVSADSLWRIANVLPEEANEAIKILTSEDKFSKSKAHNGRRIDVVDGGFLILNYERHREWKNGGDPESPGAVRTRKWREKKREEEKTNGDVSSISKSIINKKESGSETKKKTAKRSKPKCELPADWKPSQKELDTATRECLDGESQAEKFKANAQAHARKYSDWDAAFRNWLLSKYREGDKLQPQQKEPEWNN